MATLFMICTMIFFSIWFLSVRQETALLEKRQETMKTHLAKHALTAPHATVTRWQTVPTWKID